MTSAAPTRTSVRHCVLAIANTIPGVRRMASGTLGEAVTNKSTPAVQKRYFLSRHVASQGTNPTPRGPQSVRASTSRVRQQSLKTQAVATGGAMPLRPWARDDLGPRSRILNHVP